MFKQKMIGKAMAKRPTVLSANNMSTKVLP